MAAAATQPSNPINTPMTYQQLQQLAESQAAATISGENAPLQAQVGTYGSQKTQAEQNIGKEFGALQPYVQSSAQAVSAAAQQAEQMAQQVFAAAGTRMNQLHQNMAQEAQQLAQQMGGPVSTGDFTAAMTPEENALPGIQGAGVLGALGSGMADVTGAQAFAGRVFPAMQTEEVAKSDAYFNDQIKTLQDQINQNAGAKSDLVNKNLNDLLQNERQFSLNQKQLALDKTKASRDWKVQQASLHSQKLRDALAQKAAKQAGIRLGQEQQRISIEKQHVTAADRLAAQRLGLSVAEFKQRVAHEQQTAKVGQARLSLSASKDAASVVDAAMGGGKPVSMSHRVYIPKNSTAATLASVGKGGTSYWDPKKKQYYKIAHETMGAQEWAQLSGGQSPHPVSDPNRLYDLVRGTIPQLGRKATINLIRAKTGMKGWAPGKQMSYTGAQLHGMPLGELEGLARDAGYKGPLGKKSNRQAITDYLLHASR